VRTAIRPLGASLLISLGACAPGDGRTTVELSSAITSGTVDEGDSAVVALLSSGQAYCTGTVVGDRWVLTAAHCLQSMTPSEVYLGTRPAGDGRRLQVARTIIHPGFSFIGLQDDLGLVELVERAPVDPLPLLEQPLDPTFAGSTVRLVGFGSISSTDTEPPLKRTGTARISALDARKFTFGAAPSQPCLADSGAPVLQEQGGREYLAGITSSGDARCQEYARAVRVDVYADDFILPQMAGRSGGCRTAPGPSLPILVLVLLRACARTRKLKRVRHGVSDPERRPLGSARRHGRATRAAA
jgi:secreted trypsin-like serine protease